MEIQNLNSNALLCMQEAVRIALAKDDATFGIKPYGVRETPDWRQWADKLEEQLALRGVTFEKVVWGK